jgi:hypothetical protein
MVFQIGEENVFKCTIDKCGRWNAAVTEKKLDEIGAKW